jgi:hydroxymethylbilane synthase
VHSLKDLPTGAAEGIMLAAIPPRDDPRDALVGAGGAKFADLPSGARIGTGSPRRAEQLQLLRSDITCVPIRGNANTRLAKVRDGELDAVVLAYAGLARIGRTDAVSEIFEADDIVPAPGQGALAVECRASDTEMASLLASIDHARTRAAVTAERTLLAALEAGCSAPVGAHAAGTDRLRLEGVVLGVTRGDDPPLCFPGGHPPDPRTPGARPIAGDRIGRAGVDESAGSADASRVVVREWAQGDAADAAGLGRDLATRMLARGAARLIAAADRRETQQG